MRSSFESPQQQAQFESILKEFRCMTCPNQNIADSYAPVAEAMQDEIYHRLKNGESEDAIREYLLSSYGEYVVYKPMWNPSNSILWAGPFFMLIMGIGIWYLLFSKRTK